MTRSGLRRGRWAGQRVVFRWAWRMFRREWRQHGLIVALLSTAVAAAVLGTSAVYHLSPAQEAGYGRADHRLRFQPAGPGEQAAALAAARSRFGTVDVISSRATPVPGSVRPLELRAQDPRGVYGAPMLALRKGRYPAGPGEVALTDDSAAMLRAGVGGTVMLDGKLRRVVGQIENPADLNDEFALVSPRYADPAQSLTILIAGGQERVRGLPEALQSGTRESRGNTGRSFAAAGVLAAATVVLLLISLVAAAGFVAMAQRRLRQLGILAATGATTRQLRLVLLANGMLAGLASALLGGAAGTTAWLLLAPRLEAAAGHRIHRFSEPWPLLGIGLLLAVGAATAAAWWPARAAARIPVTLALSARPPRPKPAHQSALAAIALLAVGTAALVRADQSNGWLIVAGIVAIMLGILLTSAPAVRLLAKAGPRLPVGARLALRDLARHQSRAGAALAAISLGLGIPVAIVIAATAAEPQAGEGNLSDRQLVVMIGDAGPLVPDRTPAELARLRAATARLAAALDHPAVLDLRKPVAAGAPKQPPAEGGTEGGFHPVALGAQEDANTWNEVPLYIADPEIMRHFGITPSADFLTVRSGRLDLLPGMRERRDPEEVRSLQRIGVPAYGSAPTTFVTAAAANRQGWTVATTGWLIEARSPITSAQLAGARDAAVANGLRIEARDEHRDLATLRTGASVVGILLALGVLSMTVGLIRGEAGRDMRTLAATGATTRTRRTLTAVTAGTLALLGAILGTGGAYLAMIAGYLDELGTLTRVPLPHLLATSIGVPLIAIAAGWFLAARDPSPTRRPID